MFPFLNRPVVNPEEIEERKRTYNSFFFKSLSQNRTKSLHSEIKELDRLLNKEFNEKTSVSLSKEFKKDFETGESNNFFNNIQSPLSSDQMKSKVGVDSMSYIMKLLSMGNEVNKNNIISEDVVNNGIIDSFMKILGEILEDSLEDLCNKHWKYNEFCISSCVGEKIEDSKEDSVFQMKIVMKFSEFLDAKSILNLSLVCRRFNAILSQNVFWKSLYLSHRMSYFNSIVKRTKSNEKRKKLTQLFQIFKKNEKKIKKTNWKNKYILFYYSLHKKTYKKLSNFQKFIQKSPDNEFFPYYMLHCLGSLIGCDIKYANLFCKNKNFIDIFVKCLYGGLTFMEQYSALRIFEKISDLAEKSDLCYQICCREDVIKIIFHLGINYFDVVYRKFIQFPKNRLKYHVEILKKKFFPQQNTLMGNTISWVFDFQRNLSGFFLHLIKERGEYVDIIEKYGLLDYFRCVLSEKYFVGLLDNLKDLKHLCEQRSGAILLLSKGKDLIQRIVEFLNDSVLYNEAMDSIIFLCHFKELSQYFIKKYESVLYNCLYHDGNFRINLMKYLLQNKDGKVGKFYEKIKIIKRKMNIPPIEIQTKNLENAMNLFEKALLMKGKKKFQKSIDLFLKASELFPLVDEFEPKKSEAFNEISKIYLQLKDYKNVIKYTTIGYLSYNNADSIKIRLKLYEDRGLTSKIGVIGYRNDKKRLEVLLKKKSPPSMFPEKIDKSYFNTKEIEKVYGQIVPWENFDLIYGLPEIDKFAEKMKKKKLPFPNEFIGIKSNDLFLEKKKEKKKLKICNLCERKAKKKCARCQIIFYCSRKCQVNDWKNHNKVCKKTNTK